MKKTDLLIQQHELCQVHNAILEARLKTISTVWFHLCGILEKVQLLGNKHTSGCHGLRWGEGLITKGHGIVLGNGNILYLIVLVTQLYAFAQSHTLYITEGKLPDLKKFTDHRNCFHFIFGRLSWNNYTKTIWLAI